MGIKGLLPLLGSIQKTKHIRDFAGQTVGIDGYCWLHRGAINCAVQLATGQPTSQYVDFCMRQVQMLFHFGVKPYFVFDGDSLPAKSQTNVQRAANRSHHKKIGLDLLKAGKTSQAHQELKQAVSITTTMVRQVIEALRRASVDYVVAPYEADAQLVYLERNNIIDAIVTEDSDLLVFGANRLLTKLDQFGECIEINRSDFASCKEVSLVGWTDREFRQMAILSGCDYLTPIPRLGLRTAHRLVRKYRNAERVIQILRLSKNFSVPEGYEAKFLMAEMAFLYQRVFDPVTQKLVHFNAPVTSLSIEALAVIGDDLPAATAQALARGDLDPKSKVQLEAPIPIKSYPIPGRKPNLSAQDNGVSKLGQPIKQFFLAIRVPLGELDPNTLQYTDSQQATLRRHSSASWTAQSVAQTENRRVSAPVFRDSPVPQSSAPISPTTVPILPQTPLNVTNNKRPRLCSESQPATASGLPAETSRFFCNNKRPRLISQSKKHGKVVIWNDDDLQPASEGGAEPALETASPTGTIMHLKETTLEAIRVATATTRSVEPGRTIHPDSEKRQLRVSSRLPIGDRAIGKPDDRAAQFSPMEKMAPPSQDLEAAQDCNVGRFSRFAYPTPAATPENSQQKLTLSQRPSWLGRTSSLPTPRDNLQFGGVRQISCSPLTPLQRLGLGALSRQTSLSCLPPSPADSNCAAMLLPDMGFEPQDNGFAGNWPEISDEGCDARDMAPHQSDLKPSISSAEKTISALKKDAINKQSEEALSSSWGIDDFMTRYGYVQH